MREATRIRPVLMTALAMIIGMIPMALGLGEGAEQNAPLGRAVIGGLLFATVSTLLFVPVMFAGIHRRLERAEPRALTGQIRIKKEAHPMLKAQSRGVVKRAQVLVSAAVAALVIGAVVVLVLRSFHARALDDEAAVHAVQYVTTATPTVNSAGLPVALPGTLLGVTEATVYARSSGYIVRWSKDIGASVKRGDLLAEVTAPEIDQQLFQAEATRAQTAASEALAKSTADRWTSLRAKDAVTQQDLGRAAQRLPSSRGRFESGSANVSRCAVCRASIALSRRSTAWSRSETSTWEIWSRVETAAWERRCSRWRKWIRCAYTCMCRRPMRTKSRSATPSR
jgi:hypothetical protein